MHTLQSEDDITPAHDGYTTQWVGREFPVDKRLENRQMEIRENVKGVRQYLSGDVHALRAECAVIGHVEAILDRGTCFYCGVKMI